MTNVDCGEKSAWQEGVWVTDGWRISCTYGRHCNECTSDLNITLSLKYSMFYWKFFSRRQTVESSFQEIKVRVKTWRLHHVIHGWSRLVKDERFAMIGQQQQPAARYFSICIGRQGPGRTDHLCDLENHRTVGSRWLPAIKSSPFFFSPCYSSVSHFSSVGGSKALLSWTPAACARRSRRRSCRSRSSSKEHNSSESTIDWTQYG